MTPDAVGAPLGMGERVTLACLWEATAAKPGNVCRGADFADATFADYVTASVAIGGAIHKARALGVGAITLAGVSAMRGAVAANTHLGTILLLAPLAKAGTGSGLWERAASIAAATTLDDARLAYGAIRLAAPGGLGRSAEADVRAEPSVTLAEAMRLAAERDVVARQYGNGFADVRRIAGGVADLAAAGASLHDSIVRAHVQQMADEPDTLIARKCGAEVADQSAAMAAAALRAGGVGDAAYQQALADLDFWLRADGNRRNPGATADLIAAALFGLLAEDRLCWPVRFYGS